MSRKLKISLASLFSLLFLSFTVGATSPIDLETFNTHSRLTLQLDPGIKATWKDVPGGFELFLQDIHLVDLGAPFGNESEWLSRVQVSDRRLDSVVFNDTREGLKAIGRWRFPTGKKTLAFPIMESFNYRLKEPPRFSIDFWHKKGPTLAEHKKAMLKLKKEEDLKKAQARAQKKLEKRLARMKKKTKKTDTSDFCKKPLGTQGNVFVAFKPDGQKIDFSKWFSLTIPDTNYPYMEPTNSSRDADYVRLALSLYSQGKYGLVNRTIDFLEKDFPESTFGIEMKFLRANALLRLGHKVSAIKIFRELFVNYKESPVALHAGNYLAGRAFHSQEYLSALEFFLTLVRNYPDHRLAWVYHMGAAESLAAINQTDRAAEEYKWVADYAPSRQARAEAEFRIGDLFLLRKEYAQALAVYFKAIRLYPNEANRYPKVFLNRAEALYWLGEYQQSESAFKKFLDQFPGHPSGWRATYRIAEIVGRRPDAESQKSARKWFANTINHYSFKPGGTLARLRLIQCGDHAGFTYPAAKRFFESEASTYSGSGEIFLDNYKEYLALSRVRTRISMKKEGEAIELIAAFLESPISVQTKELLSRAFERVFRRWILYLLDNDRKFEAVATYSQYSWVIDRSKKPFIPDFLLRLSRAASDLELGSVALSLMHKYRTLSARFPGRQVATEELELDIDQKIERSEIAYSEAKALWLKSREKASELIRAALRKVTPESQHSYKKQIILGLLESKSGNHDKALKHAIQAQLLLSKLVGKDMESMTTWIARLQVSAGHNTEAIETYRTLQKAFDREVASIETKTEEDDGDKKLAGAEAGLEKQKMKKEIEEKIFFDTASALGLPKPSNLSELFYREAELLEKETRWGEAAKSYSKAIEIGSDDNRTNYAYARTLGKLGLKADEKKVLRKVASAEKEDFWKKLAQEALNEESNQ